MTVILYMCLPYRAQYAILMFEYCFEIFWIVPNCSEVCLPAKIFQVLCFLNQHFAFNIVHSYFVKFVRGYAEICCTIGSVMTILQGFVR